MAKRHLGLGEAIGRQDRLARWRNWLDEVDRKGGQSLRLAQVKAAYEYLRAHAVGAQQGEIAVEHEVGRYAELVGRDSECRQRERRTEQHTSGSMVGQTH